MKSRGGLGREVTSPPPSLLLFRAPFYFAPLRTIWTPGTGYVVVYADINFLMSLTVTELKARSCQTTGYTAAGPPSRSTPGTLPRELLYNTVTLWRSNIRLEATQPGCTTILAAFTLGPAATTAKHHAQLKTLLLASGSLRSYEAIMLWLNCKTNLQQFDDWKRL